jgi:predicted AAA+ superfamily ATPase
MLTGSENLMAIPKIADSLAGRMETFSLLPLSQSEIVLQTTIFIGIVSKHPKSRPHSLTLRKLNPSGNLSILPRLFIHSI